MAGRDPVESAPFFVVGSGRSGTTLLHSMLAAHSCVAMPPETQFLSNALHEAGSAVAGDQVVDLPRLLEVLRTNKYTHPLAPHIRPEDFDTSRAWTVGEVMDRVLQSYAKDKGKRRWGEKTPHHLWFWKRLNHLFPTCRFVLIMRDGRDVALSLAKAPWAPDDIYVNAYRWSVEFRKARELEAALGQDRVFRVHYEDLVQQPEPTLERLCGFLRLQYEPTMLNNVGASKEIIHAHEERWKARNRESIFTSSIGKFRRELPERTIARLNGLLWKPLTSTGRYKIVIQPPPAIERGAVKTYAVARFYASYGGRFIRRRLRKAPKAAENVKD